MANHENAFELLEKSLGIKTVAELGLLPGKKEVKEKEKGEKQMNKR